MSISKYLKSLKLLPYPQENDKEYRQDVIKRLTALEIIKNKKVNIFTFYECCNWHNPSHYNDSIGCPVNCELTQEEYDLLREVLL